MSDFTKHDQEKIRLELIPPSLLKAIGTILTFGAKKYDDDNWRKCEKWSRYYGALMRHLNAWWDGEDLDSESGHSHLWHAACCLAFLIEFQEKGLSTDDRPIKNCLSLKGMFLKLKATHTLHIVLLLTSVWVLVLLCNFRRSSIYVLRCKVLR